MAHLSLRIYETGISYYGRTYEGILVYLVLVCAIGCFDVEPTKILAGAGLTPRGWRNPAVTLIGLMLNFAGRRIFVFPEPASGPWRRQIDEEAEEAALRDQVIR